MTGPGLGPGRHGQEYTRPCKACGQMLAFLRMPGGALHPLNLTTGKNHFLDCPQRDRWKKPKRQRAPAVQAEQLTLLGDDVATSPPPRARGHYDD